MLLHLHFLVVIDQIFCSNTEILKIPNKVYDNATDVSMVLKYKPLEPG